MESKGPEEMEGKRPATISRVREGSPRLHERRGSTDQLTGVRQHDLRRSEKKIILITGITGQQGGAVARALKGSEFHLRGLTRNLQKCAELEKEGIELVQGDLEDEESLRRALQGVWGVFAVQSTGDGPEQEEIQGKRLARLAKEAGVHRFVYTSVGSADRKTGIPHFDNKHRIEKEVQDLQFPEHVILRPVFFMENLVQPWSLHGDTLSSGIASTTKLQMVAVDDIGRVAARAFTDPSMIGREIDLAGDMRTMTEAAQMLSKAMGHEIKYVQTPIQQLEQMSKGMAEMMRWFDRVGYNADVPQLEREFGHPLIKLPDWINHHAKLLR